MKITKKIAREIIFPMITLTGSEKLLSFFTKNSILNVMYHGVVNKDSSGYTARHIDAKQFEKQLKYYSKQNSIAGCACADFSCSHV